MSMGSRQGGLLRQFCYRVTVLTSKNIYYDALFKIIGAVQRKIREKSFDHHYATITLPSPF